MATVARTTDAELLRRLRARDHDAWEELYVEYQPRLRGFAYRLAGNVHDADDLVQETFVRAVPRLDRLDPDTADVSAYLFTTMRNLFLKQVERDRRQQPVAEVPEPEVPAPIEDDPERSTLLGHQQVEVRKANARLQPRQRMVLALRELEDRSYAEIGELVGMKENAVAQLIFRARESLRAELRLAQVDPERLPEECRRFLPLLAAHLDGQLKGARRDETLAHLEGCERCQAALADMREASRRYRTIFMPPPADDDREAIDAQLTSSGYWDRRPSRLALRTTAVATGIAVLLVLGGGGAALGVALSREGATTALPSTTSSTAATQTTATPRPPSTVDPTTTETTSPPTNPVAPLPGGPQPTITTQPKPEPEPTTTSEPEPLPPAPPPDTKPPTVKITSAPSETTATGSARIAFAANEAGVVFACKLDADAYAGCKSPVRLANLDAGSHTFSVRGTDEAGNVGKPASVSWEFAPLDTSPPTVTITSAPPASTTDSAASFAFSSNELATRFACSLDGAAFATCNSPMTYKRLVAGPHTFSVRATDHAGNLGQPASHAWTIVRALPDLHVSAFSRNSITITNRGTATAGASVLTIALVGTFNLPSIPPGVSVTVLWSTCRVGTYRAVVDARQTVAESDETNNTATLRNTCS